MHLTSQHSWHGACPLHLHVALWQRGLIEPSYLLRPCPCRSQSCRAPTTDRKEWPGKARAQCPLPTHQLMLQGSAWDHIEAVPWFCFGGLYIQRRDCLVMTVLSMSKICHSHGNIGCKLGLSQISVQILACQVKVSRLTWK